ncbi:hypothetical protein E9993_05840 [Labilibacter sediminis]|nr:hypothetical protein E9993_05840 [Labilibacter sediminis]
MIKVLKSIIVFVIVLGFCSFVAVNENIGSKRLARIEENVDKMVRVMNLTEKQRADILELKKVAEIKVQQANKKYEKGTEEHNAARKTISRNYQVALKRICSLEQISKWKEYKKALIEQQSPEGNQ